MEMIPTRLSKPTEVPILLEIQAHKTPAANQRIDKYDSAKN
jgi:hypothetical protein